MSTAAPAGNVSDSHSKWDYDEFVKQAESISGKLDNLMSIIKEVEVKIDDAEKRRKKAMLQAKLYRLQRLRQASAKSEAVQEKDYGGKLSVTSPNAPAVPKREEDEARKLEEEVRKLEDEEAKRKAEEDELGKKTHVEELRKRLEEARAHVEEARAKREASLKSNGKGSVGELKAPEENQGTVIGAGQTPAYWPELKNAWARYQSLGLLSSG